MQGALRKFCPALAGYLTVSAAALIGFFCGSPCAARSAAEVSREDVADRIQQHRQQIRKAEQQEASALEKLDSIDLQLFREQQHLEELAENLAGLHRKIALSQAHIEQLKKGRMQNEQALKDRLLATYKFYKQGAFKSFFSSPSYAALVRQEYYLRYVLMSDQQLFAQSLRLIEAESSSRNELLEQRSELVKLKKSLARQRNAVRQTKKERVARLAAIRREKTLQLSALAELEKHAAEMQNLVDAIPSERTGYLQQHPKFSTLKGMLGMPLKGRVVSRFGRKKYPGLQTTTFQKGIDIDCRFGQDVVAVYYGSVVYAGWFKGYGNMLIVDHGEGYYSLIAHASKLLKQVGDAVAEAEVIALSGDTGSLSGPLLHFEIRHHGKPQDPLLWLKQDTT